jgi:hypothetical protein
MYWLLSEFECIQQGRDKAICLVSSLCTSVVCGCGAVHVVTVGNCYSHWECSLMVLSSMAITFFLSFFLACLLTYSIQQSPSWDAERFSPSKEIPTFYGTRRFITTFTITRHLSLSSASSIQSILPNPTSLRFTYYPPICARVSPVVSFPQVSPPKPCTRLFHPQTRYMTHLSHFSRLYHLHNIGWGVQIMELIIMKFSPLPCYIPS